MAVTGTESKELRTLISNEAVGANARTPSGGFLLVEESDFNNLPCGALVCLQTISFSKLQGGDYILIAGEGGNKARRFVKIDSTGNSTKLVVADNAGRRQAIPFSRLMGLISGVKMDGKPYNPNAQGFLQRAAFKIKLSLARPSES